MMMSTWPNFRKLVQTSLTSFSVHWKYMVLMYGVKKTNLKVGHINVHVQRTKFLVQTKNYFKLKWKIYVRTIFSLPFPIWLLLTITVLVTSNQDSRSKIKVIADVFEIDVRTIFLSSCPVFIKLPKYCLYRLEVCRHHHWLEVLINLSFKC